MTREKYRSIFISDTHLGASYSHPEYLNHFLKTIEVENLFLVGDIFDFWAMRKSVVWNKHSNNVVQKILKLSKETKIFYIVGNHDEALRKLFPITIHNIQIVDECVHILSNGKKALVTHGDLFDFTITHLKALAKLGSFLYANLIRLNRFLQWIQVKLNLPYWSLSKYAKEKTKKAISFIKNFEDTMIDYKNRNGCDIVICGHIHTPKNSEEYVNCGDWVENFSYVVEKNDGSLEIKYFKH